MTTLNRRDFLRALGITGSTSALSACGLDDNWYKTPVESILPYVVKPDQVTPGTYTFFATTLTDGPTGRSVTARHRDGRVTFVSHNRFAPGRPAIGAAPLLELQRHYAPDRITGPRKGEAAISWDDGLAALAGAMKQSVEAGKKIVFLGGYTSGAMKLLTEQIAGDYAVRWEPLGYEAEALASEQVFGTRQLPFYGLDKAGYILSFGAPFLGGWGDADMEERYGTARDPNVGHRVARVAWVAPYRDQTGANADDWYAAAPGTEAGVARAIASLVATKTGATDVATLLGRVDVAAAASASGLTVADLESIAANLVSGEGIALPGGVSGSVELAAATYLINMALKAPAERFHLGGYSGLIHSTDELDEVLDLIANGGAGVVVVGDIDPVYALPDAMNVADRLSKADLLVSVSSQPTATQALAGLTLPASGPLEDWGITNPREGLFFLRQPAMTPVHDTRSLGDILLVAARGAGLEPAVPAGIPMPTFAAQDWAAYVREFMDKVVAGGQVGADARWIDALQKGVFGVPRVLPPMLDAAPIAWTEPTALAGGLILHTVAHHLVGDGRYADQPWAQETSDPLSGNLWGSWLEVSQAWAEAKGLVRDDLVSVKTPTGTVELPIEPRPGLRDDVAVLAFGQGHEGGGRYANGYGVRASGLFAEVASGAWTPAVATVTGTGGRGTHANGGIVTTMRSTTFTDEDRAFGVHVSAEKLAAAGDAPAHHPGELTGIHHLELDERLQAKGETYENFYLPPDHSTYRFGMTVDVNACTGCAACVVACYAENNLPVVGRERASVGKQMNWLRINRYWEEAGGHDDVKFVPMMCQQCGHAGCENVCPVLATYHNIDGLNAMVYNRCVGTRYCSNACPFSVRRFNYHTYQWPEPFNLMLNPDVSTRTMGVMEKCTFCVQRIRQTKSAWKDQEGFSAVVPDEVWQNTPACVEACPSRALTFGNRNDEAAKVTQFAKSGRTYEPLQELNVRSAINYLAKANFHDDPTAGHHGGGHHEAGHDEAHAAGAAHGHDAEGGHHEAAGHDEGHGKQGGSAEAHGAHGEAHGSNHDEHGSAEAGAGAH